MGVVGADLGFFLSSRILEMMSSVRNTIYIPLYKSYSMELVSLFFSLGFFSSLGFLWERSEAALGIGKRGSCRCVYLSDELGSTTSRTHNKSSIQNYSTGDESLKAFPFPSESNSK